MTFEIKYYGCPNCNPDGKTDWDIDILEATGEPQVWTCRHCGHKFGEYQGALKNISLLCFPGCLFPEKKTESDFADKFLLECKEPSDE